MPRGSGIQPTTEQDRRKEQQKIKDYQGLVESVNSRVSLPYDVTLSMLTSMLIREHQYTVGTLELTSKLLRSNPEYYTIWNHRRLIMQHSIEQGSNQSLGSTGEQNQGAVVNMIADDLAFLLPLLRKFPKCYWIWNYRLWLLEESVHLLSTAEARKLWQQELALAGKMLSLDSRNFHGWGYRRTVVQALDSAVLQGEKSSTSMTEQEFTYTTKMINTNLSNFSAWHTRSKLIPRLLNERGADNEARQKFLDEGNYAELYRIHL